MRTLARLFPNKTMRRRRRRAWAAGNGPERRTNHIRPRIPARDSHVVWVGKKEDCLPSVIYDVILPEKPSYCTVSFSRKKNEKLQFDPDGEDGRWTRINKSPVLHQRKGVARER